MDYSLLVLKVNMGGYMEGTSNNNDAENMESQQQQIQQQQPSNLDMQAIMRNCPSSYSRL